MTEMRADAVVIGSGPGGYVCGIRLGQLGVKTVVVERDQPGGVCLNVGCIPSKALIHAAKTYEKMTRSAGDMGIVVGAPPTVDMKKMQSWKGGIVNKLTSGVRQLLKGAGTELVFGSAVIERGGSDGHHVAVAAQGEKRIITAKNVVLATGSRPVVIPGFDIDQKRVIDSTGALDLDSVPQRLVVIGGGYIGLELGTVYAKLGSKVTVVEALDSILFGMDKDCVRVVAQKLRKMGVEVMLGTKAKRWENQKDRAVITVEGKSGEMSLDADRILVSVGRRPNSENIGLDKVGVKTDGKGFVVVDNQLRTNVPGIYAIGDVAGGMLLAHKASKEAEVVAEVIAGHKAEFDVRCIPAVIFSDPEVASAGITADEAKQRGREVKVGKFPFVALGRAIANADTDGFVKVVIDAGSKEVLGIHVVGNGASDVIAEAALAIEMGALADDISMTIHAHPTLPEAIMEAAKASLGEAIHIQNR